MIPEGLPKSIYQEQEPIKMVENNNHMILNGVDNTQITEDMQSESKTESEDSSSNIIND